MFTPRTTPVKEGEAPWAWGVPSVYQCVWYVYYRALIFGPPCYWDRATRTGSYTNAKEWLKNFREPWQVKDPTYTPVAGDIVVYDGTYGHVQFMETDVMYSEYSNGDPNSFRNGKFERKSNILGFLHYPYDPVEPVERNVNVDQIQTTDIGLRIRTSPSLSGDIIGHVKIGYYNVLDEKTKDGYTWYEIGKDRWCANISTIYLPSDNDDIIKDLERYFNNLKTTIKTKDETIENYKKRMAEIHKLSEGI